MGRLVDIPDRKELWLCFMKMEKETLKGGGENEEETTKEDLIFT